MANFRKQAFAQRLRDYMLEERGSFYKRAAAPIEYPQLQGEPGGMPSEQGMGMDPAMLEQIAAATGMDPQQLAQMPPEQLDQMVQELQGGAPQGGQEGQEGQGGQPNAMPTLNITAKGDIAVETVNNMMGTQKMASYHGPSTTMKYLSFRGLTKTAGWLGDLWNAAKMGLGIDVLFPGKQAMKQDSNVSNPQSYSKNTPVSNHESGTQVQAPTKSKPARGLNNPNSSFQLSKKYLSNNKG